MILKLAAALMKKIIYLIGLIKMKTVCLTFFQMF